MNYFYDIRAAVGNRKPLFWKRKVHYTELLSIGIVSMDGREFYAVNKDFDLKRAWKSKAFRQQLWELHFYLVRNNDLLAKFINATNFSYKSLRKMMDAVGKTNDEIAEGIYTYFGLFSDGATVRLQDNIVLYSYYGDYCHVVFKNIFSPTANVRFESWVELPSYTRSIKQMHEEQGISKKSLQNSPLHPQPYTRDEYNALSIAIYNRELYKTIMAMTAEEETEETP